MIRVSPTWWWWWWQINASGRRNHRRNVSWNTKDRDDRAFVAVEPINLWTRWISCLWLCVCFFFVFLGILIRSWDECFWQRFMFDLVSWGPTLFSSSSAHILICFVWVFDAHASLAVWWVGGSRSSLPSFDRKSARWNCDLEKSGNQ